MRQLEDTNIWQNQEQAQLLGKERSQLTQELSLFTTANSTLNDTEELLLMAIEEKDESSYSSLYIDLQQIIQQVDVMEFHRMFSGEMDFNNAYVDIQAGSGGTEAQDWAEMLLRMYLKWGDKHGFKTEIMELSVGDVAGIKSVTVKFDGDYAYGWLRTETGVHRLVRKSPFDSGNRRHTSFSAVFVYPEIDDSIEIEINPVDLRVDTYRSQGAGGQHVNTTDSAIRITHIPTNIVVQCQSERSQHKNRSHAMKQLRAKLYELELRKKLSQQQSLEDSKLAISWGSQIRSYVLDDARIKDLRTNVETRNTQAVLDGDIDMFIESNLKIGA